MKYNRLFLEISPFQNVPFWFMAFAEISTFHITKSTMIFSVWKS